MASFVETFLSVVPEAHFAEIKKSLEKSGLHTAVQSVAGTT